MGHGTPGGKRLFLRNGPRPWCLMPAPRYITKTHSASSSGMPMSEVDAMLSNGITPVMLKKKIGEEDRGEQGT